MDFKVSLFLGLWFYLLTYIFCSLWHAHFRSVKRLFFSFRFEEVIGKILVRLPTLNYCILIQTFFFRINTRYQLFAAASVTNNKLFQLTISVKSIKKGFGGLKPPPILARPPYLNPIRPLSINLSNESKQFFVDQLAKMSLN